MADKRVEGILTIENARLIFKNFAGEERQYNPAGNRNFAVIIDDYDRAKALAEDGWPVKWLRPREEGDTETAFIRAKVSYANRPPKIVTVTSRGKTQLEEDMVGMLDWAEIKSADVALSPYNWTNARGEHGVSAYLRTLYVVLEEDEFESKYPDPVQSDELPF